MFGRDREAHGELEAEHAGDEGGREAGAVGRGRNEQTVRTNRGGEDGRGGRAARRGDSDLGPEVAVVGEVTRDGAGGGGEDARAIRGKVVGDVGAVVARGGDEDRAVGEDGDVDGALEEGRAGPEAHEAHREHRGGRGVGREAGHVGPHGPQDGLGDVVGVALAALVEDANREESHVGLHGEDARHEFGPPRDYGGHHRAVVRRWACVAHGRARVEWRERVLDEVVAVGEVVEERVHGRARQAAV